eukprot:6204883-Pleurochrysis_carterae.AAC.1
MNACFISCTRSKREPVSFKPCVSATVYRIWSCCKPKAQQTINFKEQGRAFAQKTMIITWLVQSLHVGRDMHFGVAQKSLASIWLQAVAL